MALQEYKQKNKQLALGGGEHPGTLKSQGTKISQYKKVLSREKELELVGNLLKSPRPREYFLFQASKNYSFSESPHH